MFFVYILKSLRGNGLYIGKTNNFERRFYEHNSGHVSSTKSRRPFILLKKIICSTEDESTRVEKEYKKGYKREEIKKKFSL